MGCNNCGSNGGGFFCAMGNPNFPRAELCNDWSPAVAKPVRAVMSDGSVQEMLSIDLLNTTIRPYERYPHPRLAQLMELEEEMERLRFLISFCQELANEAFESGLSEERRLYFNKEIVLRDQLHAKWYERMDLI